VETVFSREVQAGLDRARLENFRRSSNLKVSADGKMRPVLRMWKSGFGMEADAPPLRGLVDLYQGGTHLFRCLIVTSEEDAGERRYEFKRATAVTGRPAVDFERREDAPAALIGHDDLTEGR
jgi:hypothetical protein